MEKKYQLGPFISPEKKKQLVGKPKKTSHIRGERKLNLRF